MRVKQSTIDKLKSFEGLRLKAYKPVKTEKYYTIGYGHCGSDVKRGMTVTEEEAETLLKKDVSDFEARMLKVVPSDLTSNQWDALLSFSYNVGLGNLKSSTLLKLIRNKADTEAIQAQFRRWVYGSNRKVLPGLVRRRNWEAELWEKKD